MKNADEFFTDYHDKVYSGSLIPSTALELLREAWQKYPDRRVRIQTVADTLKLSKNRVKTAFATKESDTMRNVMETML